jgi:hypothetical protein
MARKTDSDWMKEGSEHPARPPEYRVTHSPSTSIIVGITLRVMLPHAEREVYDATPAAANPSALIGVIYGTGFLIQNLPSGLSFRPFA